MPTNNRLTNKGWAQMSALLDREMPQKKKRRPFGWWWAAAAFFALVTANFWLQYRGKQMPQQDTSAGNFSESLPTTATAGIAVSSGMNQAPPETDSPAPRTISEGLSTGRKNGHTELQSRSNLQSLSATTPAPPEEIISGSLSADISPAPSLTTSFQANYPQTTPVIPSLALHTVSSSAELTEDGMKRADYSLSENTLLKKPVPSALLNFGLMAAANAFQVKQMPGLAGGISIDFLFPGRKFGLQSGLVYRYQKFSGENRPVIPISYSRYVGATENNSVSQNIPRSWIYFNAANGVLIPVMQSHQLELPLLAFWQIRQKYRLYAGGTVLRHIWVNSSDKVLYTYDLSVVTTQSREAIGNINNVITNQLPAWEKHIQTGVSYSPLKRLELGIFYRAVFIGKPTLSDGNKIYSKCANCDDTYPEAKVKTDASLRPISLQMNATFKF